MAGLFNTTNIYYLSCTTECIINLRIDYSSNVSFTTWDVHRQMLGASLSASLGDIMLITNHKVVETPGTMLCAVQVTTTPHGLTLLSGLAVLVSPINCRCDRSYRCHQMAQTYMYVSFDELRKACAPQIAADIVNSLIHYHRHALHSKA